MSRRSSRSSTCGRRPGARRTACRRPPSTTPKPPATPIGSPASCCTLANPVWVSGRADTVLRWMEWFEANGLIERYPAIAVHGALMLALIGRPGGTERWAAAAESTTATGTLADGNTIEGTLAYLRALLCRNGIEEMRRDAQIASNGLSPASPYRATMLHVEGVVLPARGRPRAGRRRVRSRRRRGDRAGVLPFVPVLLAERGIVGDRT